MTILLAIDFVLLASAIATALVCFNALVGELYKNNQAEWQRLGCPTCFAAQMKSDDRAKTIPTMGLEWSWMFNTPSWVREKPKTIRLLRLMRIASVVVYVTILVWLVGFVWKVI